MASLAALPLSAEEDPARELRADSTQTLETPATDAQSSEVHLGVMTVTGNAVADGYLADAPSSVATKTSLPPRKTPFTVNQASQELIQERGDRDIFETLEGFAGVTTNSNTSDVGQGMAREIAVRGFSLSGAGQTLINGQRTYSTGSQMRNADNFETVELLRGPAALYYGAAQPGGIINYNYKRPKAEAAYVLRGETDDEGTYGGMFDATGALDDNNALLYRFVGSYTDYQDDQDHIWSRPKSVLAAMTWLPSDVFETTLTYEYFDQTAVPEQENNKYIRGTTDYYPVPRDFFWGSKNDRSSRESHTYLWDFAWQSTDWLKVNGYLNYQTAEQWYQNTRVVGGGGRGGSSISPVPDAAGNVPRYISLSPGAEYENFSGGIDFTGSFTTAGFQHVWLVGGGLGWTRTRSSGLPTSITCLYGQNAPSASCPDARSWVPDDLNMFDPDHGSWPFHDIRSAAEYMVPWAKREDRNLYLQDMVHLPDGKTRMMLAAGWSEYGNQARGAYDWTTRVRAADPEVFKVDKWSPRVALMHDITPSATIYVSYGESFNPQPSLTLMDVSGTYLQDPEEGVQYEVGYKQELDGGRAMFALALFRIDKQNIARAANADTCDPNVDVGDADFCYSSLDGKVRSQGVELELSGSMTDWWAASIGYSYLDNEVLKTDDIFNLGKSQPYLSRHYLALWNKFRLYQGAAGKLSLGAGLKAYSKSNNGYGADGTDWHPGYGIADMGLFWEGPISPEAVLKLSLNVNNLFDKTYYDRRRYKDAGAIVWGNERRVSLAGEVRF